LLLDCGAKVDYKQKDFDNFMEDLFHFAVSLSKSYLMDLTRLMLKYGADPNVFSLR